MIANESVQCLRWRVILIFPNAKKRDMAHAMHTNEHVFCNKPLMQIYKM